MPQAVFGLPSIAGATSQPSWLKSATASADRDRLDRLADSSRTGEDLELGEVQVAVVLPARALVRQAVVGQHLEADAVIRASVGVER